MKKAISKEFNLFLNALMFFTRIPCPRVTEYSEAIMSKTLRYYPLTGFIVAAITAGVLWVALLVMPVPVAVDFCPDCFCSGDRSFPRGRAGRLC